MRTAIGDYGGSLKDLPPTELAARVVKEALSRANNPETFKQLAGITVPPPEVTKDDTVSPAAAEGEE